MEGTYSDLKAKWIAGERDRELALHLMFHCWMHWADPPFVTGMNSDENAISIWLEIYRWFGGETSTDAEFLCVTAIMAAITPEELGGEDLWRPRINKLEARLSELQPDGLRPEIFVGRGSYGDYFAHQLRPTFQV